MPMEDSRGESGTVVSPNTDIDVERGGEGGAVPRIYWTGDDEDTTETDANMLKRVAADTGRFAFGVVALELWVLSADGKYLFAPKGGKWVDPAFVHTAACHGEARVEAISRLMDATRPDYVPSAKLPPGSGLAGALWSEAAASPLSTLRDGERKRWRAMNVAEREEALDSREEQGGVAGREEGFETPLRAANDRRRVAWREIGALAIDPDQPYNPRLTLLARCGFGLAAGCPFRAYGGLRGMVVYMTCEEADQRKLKSATNEAYLKAATSAIGAVYALRGPRMAVVAARGSELQAVKRRVRNKLLVLIRMDVKLSDLAKPTGATMMEDGALAEEDSHDGKAVASTKIISCKKEAKRRLAMVASKSKGGNVQPPPYPPWDQVVWALMGIFLTLLCISRLNKLISTESNGDFSIVMGPFGALVTLQYCLTAAPASQPQNAMLGQFVALSIAIGVGKMDRIDLWIRHALGPTLSIAVMYKLGLTHPPAGAGALIFSGGAYGWGHLGFMLVGNIIAIAVATIVNNMNEKRQYPTSWGFGRWVRL